MAQLMRLPLTVSFFSKIQMGFTFLVPAHPHSPRQRAIKRVLLLLLLLVGKPLWFWSCRFTVTALCCLSLMNMYAQHVTIANPVACTANDSATVLHNFTIACHVARATNNVSIGFLASSHSESSSMDVLLMPVFCLSWFLQCFMVLLNLTVLTTV